MELLTGWSGLSKQGASAECGVGVACHTDQLPAPHGPARSVEFSRAWVITVALLLEKCTVAQQGITRLPVSLLDMPLWGGTKR